MFLYDRQIEGEVDKYIDRQIGRPVCQMGEPAQLTRYQMGDPAPQMP